MTEFASVYLHIRKLFGSLIPGMVWTVLLLSVIAKAPETLQKVEMLLPGMYLPAILFVIGSYLLGLIGNHFSIRLLDTLGEAQDRLARWWVRRRGVGGRIVTFFAERLQLGATQTMLDDLTSRAASRPDLPQLPLDRNDIGRNRWGVYKLYVVEHAKALGKELYDVEGEINFIGSMALPALVAAVVCFVHGFAFGWVALAFVLYLSLRFQYLRHYEISVVIQAYTALLANVSTGIR